MPPKRSTKKHSNGHKSKSTPSKSPQAISPLKHRANGSKIDYIVNARDVMSLKFVRTASDLESLDGFFSPVYVHQLFTNEKIIGYKDLQIRVFFSQPAFHCYIEIEYNEKLKHDDTTDIVQEFRKWIKAGFTQNKQQFIKKLDDEFVPYGELHCQFIKGDNNNNSDEDIDLDIDINNKYNLRFDAEKTAKSESKYYKNVRNKNRNNKRKLIINNDDSDYSQSGNDGDDDDESSVESVKSEEISPRNARLIRRKRRISELNNSKKENDSDSDSDSDSEALHRQPRKRRKLNDRSSSSSSSESDGESESDLEDQKKDCIQGNDYDMSSTNNCIVNSRFSYDNNGEMYEIRLGSFCDSGMREFHLRLQFFVLLYIESSSFLDVNDFIWEVMVIYRRYEGYSGEDLYETLGYLTLYKFYAFPDKKRLRISQVIIFPPYQRKGLGFEALQHVYKMAKYRDFIEVNVEDPGEGFQKLRDTTDVYNAYECNIYNSLDFQINNLTTYHNAMIYGNNNGINIDKEEFEQEISYSGNTKKNKKKCNGYKYAEISLNKKALFPFISQHKKISSDIYHSAIINCHKILKITPQQARIAYECLKLEYINKFGNDFDWKLYTLDVKRRLYAVLTLENIHNYDENGIFARLTQEFNATIDRYQKIIKKRNQWLKGLNDWDKTHEYPLWITKKLNDDCRKKYKNISLNKKKSKNRKKR